MLGAKKFTSIFCFFLAQLHLEYPRLYFSPTTLSCCTGLCKKVHLGLRLLRYFQMAPDDPSGLDFVPAPPKYRRHNRKRESYLRFSPTNPAGNSLNRIQLAHLLTCTAALEVGDDVRCSRLLWQTCQEGNCSTHHCAAAFC